MVGHRLVEIMRSNDLNSAWRVVIVAEEARPAYDRVELSSYLDGKSADDLSLVSHEFLNDPSVDLRLATTATEINRGPRTVTTADGATVGYDALVLATGSRPFVPPLPGRDLTGCFVYRTVDDLDAIRAAAVSGRTGLVVGGGLLGLEAANGLRLVGMRPQVIEMAPRLMPLQIDEGGGEILGRLVRDAGLPFRCGVAMRSIDAGPGGEVRGVTLTDGTTVEADLVVFAAGVRPRHELADSAGLDLGDRGGILVDEHCRTADKHIWAIGDCAAVGGRCHGLVAPGYRMAEVVAEQLLGSDDTVFSNADTSTSLKLLGVGVASFGDAHAKTPRSLELAYTNEKAGTYAKLVLADDTRTLLGGVLVGDASAYPVLRSLVGHQLPAGAERLLSESRYGVSS